MVHREKLLFIDYAHRPADLSDFMFPLLRYYLCNGRVAIGNATFHGVFRHKSASGSGLADGRSHHWILL